MLKTGSLSNRTVQLAFGSAIAVLLVVGAFSYRSIGASHEGIILVAGVLLGLNFKIDLVKIVLTAPSQRSGRSAFLRRCSILNGARVEPSIP
jgi:hypothetical protein